MPIPKKYNQKKSTETLNSNKAYKNISWLLAIPILVFGAFYSAQTISCSSSRPISNASYQEAPRLDKDAQKIENTAGSLSVNADNIDTQTDMIKEKVPEEVKPIIEPNTTEIKRNTSNIREMILRLTESATVLKEKDKNIQDLNKNNLNLHKDNNSLKDKVKKLEDENNILFRKMLAWIGVSCVIGIGICLILAIWFKNPVAFFVATALAAVLGVSIVVSMYMQWIAYATIGVAAVAIGYTLYRVRNSQNALKEVVQTGEIAKKYLPVKARETIFGGSNNIAPIADSIQSNNTRYIVKNIRKKLN